MSAADVKPIALYVHWPWCVRKCPYCDFNSHAIGSGADEAGYILALLKDVDAAVALAGRRPVSSVFFGGGTPSLMSVAGFETLMNGLRERLPFAENAEITLEANPGTHEAARFAGYVANGVNRFSIGVQSFNDERLKALGRIHDRRQALQAVETALKLVDDINLDVMYALPGQLMDGAEEDARTAVASGATHLSFYELTIEEGTAFYKREPAGLPDSDTAAEMGETVASILAQPGLSTTKFRATPSRDTVAVIISTTGRLAITSGWEPARTARLRPKAAFFAPNGELIRSYTWTMRPTAVSPLNSVSCLPSRFPLSSCSTFCVSMTACL